MKKTAASFALIFFVMLCFGQQINRAEYFINNDPGYGLATEIPISAPGNNLILDFNVDVSELSQGFHMMVLRARDDLGQWSNSRQFVFYVFYAESNTEARIEKAEYYIDTDPGFGLATEIPISTPGNNLTLSFDVDLSELAQGFHMMVFRARDDLGRWGNTRQQVFYVFKSILSDIANISGIEYYVDNDPGFGNGTFVAIETPGNHAVFDFFANMNDLSEGDHVLYFRAKDALNRWSHTNMHGFSLIISDVGEKKITSWFKMYPNPNKGNFIIDFSDLPGGGIKLKIVDLNGRTVYSDQLHGETISLSLDLQAGIYLMTLESGNKTFVQKLVIKR
jgi:hypothetical protein